MADDKIKQAIRYVVSITYIKYQPEVISVHFTMDAKMKFQKRLLDSLNVIFPVSLTDFPVSCRLQAPILLVSYDTY